jgi:hypothetical protein
MAAAKICEKRSNEMAKNRKSWRRRNKWRGQQSLGENINGVSA